MEALRHVVEATSRDIAAIFLGHTIAIRLDKLLVLRDLLHLLCHGAHILIYLS